MYKKKSLSPLIATILLIVVSVILITVVLTWGSSFTKEKLSTTQVIQNKDFTGLITSRPISSQNILISNNSSKDLNVTGYKIISSIDHYLYDYFENKIYNLDQPLIINPNSAQTLQIDCYPESSFFIDLITDQNIYVRTQISARSINDVDSLKCGLVLDFDSINGVLNENTGKSFTPYNIDILDLGNGYTSASFNGTNSYISFGNPESLIFGEKPFSVVILFKTNSVSTSQAIVSKGYLFGGTPLDNKSWSIGLLGSSSRIYFDTYKTGQRRALVSINLITTNWQYLVTTRDQELGKIYFNNSLDISGPVVNPIEDSFYNLMIGRIAISSIYYFNGLIPIVKIYDRVLTEEEISNLYNKTKVVFN
ncbi:MAG: LamG domain-containing protein [Candidatus ainarchaeum sp.]|nr:LamG domain-containing protein [Candidatus ainarchaeum sp.]